MARNAPGKHYRNGISLLELNDMFPDEATARQWFEGQLWPGGQRICPRCGGHHTNPVPNERPMPYHCADCRKYFSVRTGTALERSKVPLRKWVFAIHICATSLKGVSSLKLHRDLNVTQTTAWFMLHRIREAWDIELEGLEGPVEVDETYFGGKRKNMANAKRKEQTGRGTAGKTAVVGVVDRNTKQASAQVVTNTDKATLHGFIADHVETGAVVYTDEAGGYQGLTAYRHESVRHAAREYVRGVAHTNGIESFWSLLKRAYVGVYHHLSPKHLQRYVNEFAGRKGIRELDTMAQMGSIATGLVGRRLMYRDLIHGTGT